jgi:ribosome maturation factor RimP
LSKVTERIEAAIENTVQSMGYRIVDVEIGREDDSKVLFVYIDSPQGIGLDDCEAVSKAIDPIIDELDPISDAYFLCVSSPGVDRPLKRPADFQYAIGKEVELGLYKAQNGKKKYVGILQSYEEEKNSITLNVKGREIPFDLKDVTRVRPTIQF